LVYKNGKYSIDFDDFEKKAKEAKLFLLCSPHNPTGRVWSEDKFCYAKKSIRDCDTADKKRIVMFRKVDI